MTSMSIEEAKEYMVSDLVAITHLARMWASPDGMLGSNKLLTEEQTTQLNTWVDIIQETLKCKANYVHEEVSKWTLNVSVVWYKNI